MKSEQFCAKIVEYDNIIEQFNMKNIEYETIIKQQMDTIAHYQKQNEQLIKSLDINVCKQNIQLIEHNNNLSRMCYNMLDGERKDMKEQIDEKVECNIIASNKILDELMNLKESFVDLFIKSS